MTKPRNFQVVNLQQKRYSFQLRMPLDGTFGVHAAPSSAEAVASLLTGAAPTLPAPIAQHSLAPAVAGEPAFETFADVMPQEGDYIYPLFRALSQELIEGHWLDFTEPGVLEKAVPLFLGQTIYKNHNFYDVERWLGAVNQAVWDAKGEKTEGVPGINVELKVDWKVAPKIARGLLMKPPAVHSISVTVICEIEYSHPELAEENFWTFYDLLGEKVGGEVVRFIVKEILACWEISFVFQGADTRAKGVDEVSETARESFAARTPAALPPPTVPAAAPAAATVTAPPPASTQETHKVKLTAAQKQSLGLGTVGGEEVEDSVVLGAVERLSARAAAGDTLLAAGRAECLRVATLAEAGEGEQLDPALAGIINAADAAQLASLTEMYSKRAAAKFTQTCTKCGAQTETRSSVEALAEGAEEGAAQKPKRVGANRLH
jgi:hypothetical protein